MRILTPVPTLLRIPLAAVSRSSLRLAPTSTVEFWATGAPISGLALGASKRGNVDQ